MRVPDDVELRLAPGPRVRVLARELGTRPAALWCAGLLCGEEATSQVLWIGGRHAQALTNPSTGGWIYWPKVWAARALLYVWDDVATDAVIAGLADEAWRVREMAAKVVRLRALPGAHLLEALAADPLPRVRIAGLRALAAVGESENASSLLAALDDPDISVAEAAADALTRLERRLDRTF